MPAAAYCAAAAAAVAVQDHHRLQGFHLTAAGPSWHWCQFAAAGVALRLHHSHVHQLPASHHLHHSLQAQVLLRWHHHHHLVAHAAAAAAAAVLQDLYHQQQPVHLAQGCQLLQASELLVLPVPPLLQPLLMQRPCLHLRLPLLCLLLLLLLCQSGSSPIW
jgi:hypothetical protein